MTKIVAIIAIVAAFTAVIIFLWQRQPKNPNSPQASSVTETNNQNPQAPQDFVTNPADGTIVNSAPLQLQGKSTPNNTLLIFSNGQQYVTKTDDSGNFKIQITPGAGLNLYKIISLSKDLETTKDKNLSLYYSKEDIGKTAYAGSIKTIFDTLLTITTPNGDKNVRTGSATKFDIPKDPNNKEATQSVTSIRIGDYAIATGNGNGTDSISATNVQILRDNKPQLVEQFTVGTITTAPKNNIFSAKNKNGQSTDFKLAKTSRVQIGGTDAKTTDIAKDKTAIIIFSKTADTNTPDLIYVLP
ncbi:MAG TPA: hypothetical protein VLE91_01640 [Candidatus Saccharimonadales bacterium]|nr:hypothetical protein [Candidatus Saccharimonadales bacterium]